MTLNLFLNCASVPYFAYAFDNDLSAFVDPLLYADKTCLEQNLSYSFL